MVEHGTPFIATIVISLALAYAGGLFARAIGVPVIVGYLFAGILVGPYTPGFVADQQLTLELAEIGVALLLFTVGLHFSLRDMVVVWHVVVPGAILQIALCTGLGFLVGTGLGWPVPASIVLGLAIAISSTAVSTKALEARSQLGTDIGRIALGWLVVQDIVVIMALVLLPVVSHEIPDAFTLAALLGKTLAMVILFAALLLGGGRWVLPQILRTTARFGSQELFTLGVIVIALGIAYGSATLLGLSLALGAFFAGLVLGESDLSYQSAAESLPIQNIFTVLFFVSVGMLFDPMLFLEAPAEIVGLVVAIITGCGLTFMMLMLVLGVRPHTAGATAGTLAQIGEFSFILTSLAVGLAVMDADQRGTLLAAALVTIILHSLTIRFYTSLGSYLDARLAFLTSRGEKKHRRTQARVVAAMQDHVIVVGMGRVGRVIVSALEEADQHYVAIEADWRICQMARKSGAMVFFGDATRSEVFDAASAQTASMIVVAMPDAFRSRRVIELARQANSDIAVVSRAHSDEEYEYMSKLGVGLVVMGEREIALSMSDYTLRQVGISAEHAQNIVDQLRIRLDGAADSDLPEAKSIGG
ncbi:MAG: cation:proton antiporter [Hyphomicrobiales bacterium]|nr:cation:proton antiporter [Hyphomicrobiales bacterium]